MIYYHVTDYYCHERILVEGLKGNPVVYVTHSKQAALAIRQCQLQLREKFGACIVLKIDYDGELFVDPNVRPFNTAWMIYDDILPSQIQLCY